MPQEELHGLLSVISIMAAVFGLIVVLLTPKENEMVRKKGVAIFAGGMAFLTAIFPMENPDVLEAAKRQIALTLIGMVIVSIEVIRLVKK